MNIAEASSSAALLAIAIGAMAKGCKAFPDRFIPVLCCLIGMLFVPLLTKQWTLQNAVVGFCAGFSATGMNQQFRQLLQSKTSNTKTQKP